MHAALAGTQFSVSEGPPWGEDEGAVPHAPSANGEHGERRTELVCIGQELDSQAAAAALDGCLLTEQEMARGVGSWSSLPDPFPREEHKH